MLCSEVFLKHQLRKKYVYTTYNIHAVPTNYEDCEWNMRNYMIHTHDFDICITQRLGGSDSHHETIRESNPPLLSLTVSQHLPVCISLVKRPRRKGLLHPASADHVPMVFLNGHLLRYGALLHPLYITVLMVNQ